ncbi:MAG: 6-bladed beta-propeller [bacterium]
MRSIENLVTLYVGVILICSSCVDNSSGEQISGNKIPVKNKYYIDIKNDDKISFYDIFEKVELIPLETNIGSLIGSIGKVQYYESKYCVLDRDQNSILIFSEDGFFVNRIRKEGRGPGEYTLLYDFVVNAYTGDLELLNPRGQILVVDSLGRVINEIKLPRDLRASHFIYNITRDTTVLYTLFEDKQVVFFDRRTGEIFNKEYHIEEFLKGTQIVSPDRSPFYSYNNTLFFFDAANSIIYKVTQDKLVCDLVFDFGEHQLNYDNWPEDRALQYYVNTFLASDYVYGFQNFIKNDSLIIFRCIFDRIWHTVLFKYKTGDTRIIKKFKEKTVFPGIFDFFEQGIYAIVEPKNIQLIVNEDYLDEKNKEILNSVSLEDNPVIIKYYWK